MVKKYQRSKNKYTSRQAWKDIAMKTGLRPNQVKSNHNDSSWIWIRK